MRLMGPDLPMRARRAAVSHDAEIILFLNSGEGPRGPATADARVCSAERGVR
jgi:hypothetical protein